MQIACFIVNRYANKKFNSIINDKKSHRRRLELQTQINQDILQQKESEPEPNADKQIAEQQKIIRENMPTKLALQEKFSAKEQEINALKQEIALLKSTKLLAYQTYRIKDRQACLVKNGHLVS